MLKGDLSTTPLAPLLLDLAAETATGCLHILDADADEALVYFRSGDIYAVFVPGRRPQLGAKLISSGALDPAALADALEAQRDELQGWKLGELLVHLGYVDQPVVEAFVREQVKDALWDLMRWSEGRWKFRKSERTREDVAPPMPVDELLAVLRDRGLEWETITAVVHGPTAVPMLSSGGVAQDETLLDSDAWSMLCKIDGERTLAELARDCGYTVFEAGLILVRLVQAGLVDIEEDIAVAGSADPADEPTATGDDYAVVSALAAALGEPEDGYGDDDASIDSHEDTAPDAISPGDPSPGDTDHGDLAPVGSTGEDDADVTSAEAEAQMTAEADESAAPEPTDPLADLMSAVASLPGIDGAEPVTDADEPVVVVDEPVVAVDEPEAGEPEAEADTAPTDDVAEPAEEPAAATDGQPVDEFGLAREWWKSESFETPIPQPVAVDDLPVETAVNEPRAGFVETFSFDDSVSVGSFESDVSSDVAPATPAAYESTTDSLARVSAALSSFLGTPLAGPEGDDDVAAVAPVDEVPAIDPVGDLPVTDTTDDALTADGADGATTADGWDGEPVVDVDAAPAPEPIVDAAAPYDEPAEPVTGDEPLAGSAMDAAADSEPDAEPAADNFLGNEEPDEGEEPADGAGFDDSVADADEAHHGWRGRGLRGRAAKLKAAAAAELAAARSLASAMGGEHDPADAEHDAADSDAADADRVAGEAEFSADGAHDDVVEPPLTPEVEAFDLAPADGPAAVESSAEADVPPADAEVPPWQQAWTPLPVPDVVVVDAQSDEADTERLLVQQIAAEQAEAERLLAEQAEAERVEAERVETERLLAEQAETERVETERLLAEQAETEQAETERLEAEQAEIERLEAERAEAQRIADAEREMAELAAQAAERESVAAANAILAELSYAPPAVGDSSAEPEPATDALDPAEPGDELPVPEPVGAAASTENITDTAALLRELASLGGDEPPPPPAAGPPPARPKVTPAPEKKKKRLFGR